MGNIIVGFLHDQEIRHHGTEWLSQVTDEPTKNEDVVAVADDDDDNNKAKEQTKTTLHWKPLEDWMTLFEPTDEICDEGSQHNHHAHQQHGHKIENAMKSKATHILLRTIDRRISSRVLKLILDVSSKVLTLAELSLINNHNDSSFTFETTRKILNNMNGVILSYRFQHDDKKIKFEYYRRIAIDNLTKAIWETYLPNENIATKLVIIQKEIQKTILQLNDKIRPIVEDTLNEILFQVNDRIDHVVEQKFNDSTLSMAFEERLLQLDLAANLIHNKIESMEVVAEKVATVADQAVVIAVGTNTMIQKEQDTFQQTTVNEIIGFNEKLKIQENTTITTIHENAYELERDMIATKDVYLQQKTQVLTNFVDLLKSLVMTKMDQLTVRMVHHIDHLFVALYEIHLLTRVAETKSLYSLQEIQNKMYDRVQQLADYIKEHVETEVKIITDTIGVMMTHPEEEDEEKEVEKIKADIKSMNTASKVVGQ